MLPRMVRFLVLLIAACMLASQATACGIQGDAERSNVAAYVADGLACLENPPADFRFDENIEQAFIAKINAERRQRGLKPFAIRAELLPAARFQSLDMGTNAFFGHQSPDGRYATERIAAFDRTMLAQATAENIAVFGPAKCQDQNGNPASCFNLPGYRLPTPGLVAEDLHQKLMDSEGHRANILSEEFTHLAVGVARTDSGFYVTQLFAQPIGELAKPLPTILQTNTRMGLKPKIEGWDLGGYALIDANRQRTDLRNDRLSRVEPGEMHLIVVGENEYEEKRGTRKVLVTERLNLTGPSFTLVEATES